MDQRECGFFRHNMQIKDRLFIERLSYESRTNSTDCFEHSDLLKVTSRINKDTTHTEHVSACKTACASPRICAFKSHLARGHTIKTGT